jgi:hypothetical protein
MGYRHNRFYGTPPSFTGYTINSRKVGTSKKTGFLKKVVKRIHDYTSNRTARFR